METINRPETISMPMLRVRCIAPISLYNTFPIGGWPEYVQTLPPVGSVMVNAADHYRAYVENYSFGVDGIIVIHLTLEKPK